MTFTSVMLRTLRKMRREKWRRRLSSKRRQKWSQVQRSGSIFPQSLFLIFKFFVCLYVCGHTVMWRTMSISQHLPSCLRQDPLSTATHTKLTVLPTSEASHLSLCLPSHCENTGLQYVYHLIWFHLRSKGSRGST